MFKSPVITIIILLLFTSALNAQKQRFIILRHAEKDTTVAGSQMMQADPPLNIKGQERAQSLIRKFKKYKISKIYSTHYNRTKSTVLPLQIGVSTMDALDNTGVGFTTTVTVCTLIQLPAVFKV